jgi:hypothetical protein
MPATTLPGSRSIHIPGPASLGKPKRERRQNVRFPISLPVRYTLAKNCGWGRIVNIGSGGALFTVSQQLKPEERVELCIGWPVLLHQKVPLNLVAYGVIVRSGEGCAAVKFEQYGFRTASAAFRRQSLPPASLGIESHG